MFKSQIEASDIGNKQHFRDVIARELFSLKFKENRFISSNIMQEVQLSYSNEYCVYF